MIFDERLTPDNDSQTNIIYDEHLVRYRLAAKLAQGKKVLDIACGSGYGANILAEAGAAQVVAVDISPEAVAAAQKKYTAGGITHPLRQAQGRPSAQGGHPSQEGILFKVGDAEEIKEADGSLDLIVSFETIEHLKNPEKYLAELKRVLKKDGIALISTPNKEIFRQKNPFHLHEFTKREFTETLKKYFANLNVLEQSSGLASYIKPDKALGSEINFSNFGAPLYFIAVASQSAIAENLFTENVVSVNPLALERRQNNPAVKMVDKIYSVMIKIPGVKSFLRILK